MRGKNVESPITVVTFVIYFQDYFSDNDSDTRVTPIRLLIHTSVLMSFLLLALLRVFHVTTTTAIIIL